MIPLEGSQDVSSSCSIHALVTVKGQGHGTDTITRAPVKVYLLRAVRMSVAAVASRPEVGSSMNSREGLDTNSSPMFTLFLCPPLETTHFVSVHVDLGTAAVAV